MALWPSKFPFIFRVKQIENSQLFHCSIMWKQFEKGTFIIDQNTLPHWFLIGTQISSIFNYSSSQADPFFFFPEQLAIYKNCWVHVDFDYKIMRLDWHVKIKK